MAIRRGVMLAMVMMLVAAACAPRTAREAPPLPPAPHPPGAGPSLDAIRSAGRLRVAADLSSPPMAFRDASGPRGFDVDVVTLIAQALGVRADIVDTPLAAMREGLPPGADLAAGALSAGLVPGLATEPYGDAAPVIVWGAKTSGGTSAELRGRRVAAAAGSPGERLARDAGAFVVTTYLPEQSLAMVAEGRVDAAVAGGPEALGFVSGGTGLRASAAGGPSVPLALIVRPGADDLAAYVSGAVRELRGNGGLDRLRRRWRL
ncbi:MAG TPA: transporter substrate-binding domain-containing protein [bacterium]|nr:transporter substrate-binding domain-containing protein [bacterium]